jgi:primosomal replication protein N
LTAALAAAPAGISHIRYVLARRAFDRVAVEVSGSGCGSGRRADSGLAVALASRQHVEVGRGFDTATPVEVQGVLAAKQ